MGSNLLQSLRERYVGKVFEDNSPSSSKRGEIYTIGNVVVSPRGRICFHRTYEDGQRGPALIDKLVSDKEHPSQSQPKCKRIFPGYIPGQNRAIEADGNFTNAANIA